MNFSIEILLGFLAVIAAITVPLIIYFLQKSKKRLAYEVVSNTQLVGVKSEVQNKIKIYYENKLVENVHLVSIRLINSGNQPISIEDFARPINIKLGSNTNILTCEVLEKNPKDLDIVISKMQNSVKIQPLLLNPNDSLTLNILLSDYRGGLEVSARVRGISNIKVYREPESIKSIFLFLLFVLLLILNAFNAVSKNKIGSFFGIDGQNLVLILMGPIIIFICYTLISILYQATKDFFIRKVREIYSEENKE